MLYTNARCTIRVNSSLSPPIPLRRGIRQGDPISGLLYSVSVEPFLALCRTTLEPYGLRIPGSDTAIVASAHADDLYVILVDNRGFLVLHTAFVTYARASGAKLNCSKSRGLFSVSWSHRTDNPLGFEWNSEGLKVLGVYLGNSQEWEAKNWTALTESIQSGIDRYTKWKHSTTIRGRRIIANQLLGSKLVHVLTVLQPPKQFITTIHLKLIKFVWGGRHWLNQNHVFAEPRVGGIGLTNIHCKAMTLRLRFLASFLSPDAVRNQTYLLHKMNLNRYAINIKDSLLEPIRGDWLRRLQPFYRSVL